MSRLLRGEVDLQVPASSLWKCLSRELIHLLPKLVPKMVSGIQILEGDGGLGTILLLRFESDVGGSNYQREKVVEMDDRKRVIANEVLDGGYKEMGFSYFKTRFELKERGESLTCAECTVEYETVGEQVRSPEEALQASFFILKSMETYLLSK